MNETNNTTRVQVTILNGTVTAAVRADNTPVQPVPEFDEDGSDVVVAIIDTGADLENPELTGRFWQNPGEVAGDGIDNDGNGFIDDVNGFNFISHTADVSDDHGHGTFSAGMLVSGQHGIAKGVELMVLKALDETGNGTNDALANAILYAVDQGADIISLPVDAGGSLELLRALEYADLHQVLVVSASGNAGASVPGFVGAQSGSLQTVLSVGGLWADGSRLPESNRVGGSGAVQIDAAGVGVSVLPGGEHATYRGTSIAAMYTTGAAALVMAANPDLAASQVRDALIVTGDDTASDSDSRGVLNIDRALKLARRMREVRLVTQGTNLFVATTAFDDDVVAEPGWMAINGIRFALAPEITRLTIQDPGGLDRIRFIGSGNDDYASAENGFARVNIGSLVMIGTGFERVRFEGEGGYDRIIMQDTSGDDRLEAGSSFVSLVNDTTSRVAVDFEFVQVQTTGGHDTATIQGTSGIDRYFGNRGLSRLTTDNEILQIERFDVIDVDLDSGSDFARINGSYVADQVQIDPNQIQLTSAFVTIVVAGAESSTINTAGDWDSVTLTGSVGDDLIYSRPGATTISGNGFIHRVYGADDVHIDAGGGRDSATLIGSDSVDVFESHEGWASVGNENYHTTLVGVGVVYVFGGHEDRATFAGTSGEDRFYSSVALTSVTSANQRSVLRGFGQVTMIAGSEDYAQIVDEASDDDLRVTRSAVVLETATRLLNLDGFGDVRASSLADSGVDRLEILDSDLDFAFSAFGDWEWI